MTPTLPERLRHDTRALHTAAERSPLMAALLRGRLSGADYAALLHNLHAVYAALEPALARHAQHPAIAPFMLAGLWRAEALAADLADLRAAGHAAPADLVTATRDYVDRIAALDRDRPELLVAHAYVRYLGDLNGGQRLREIVAASPSLGAVGAPAPTAFYEFGDAPATAALRLGWRAGLATLPADAALVDALVEEAVSAFRRHVRIFAELAEHSTSLTPAPI